MLYEQEVRKIRVFVQVDEQGRIIQRARGYFDEAPFENRMETAYEIPEEIAEDVFSYPECYICQDGEFVRVKEPEVIPPPLTPEEKIAQLEAEKEQLEARLKMAEDSAAEIAEVQTSLIEILTQGGYI